jgi:mannitol/fructose-specific phosphotransferase system IIA component (Ntr-type)
VKLNDKFDGIDIVKTLSVSQVTQSAIDEVDLIISTVRTSFKSEKIVQVSALLSERDLLKIQKAMLKFGKGNIKEVSHKTKEQEIIEEVIEDELCFIESASMNFVELIEKYGAKLEQKGFVKPGFTQNVIARETRGSTYIGNGVAIPHSTQDFVNDSKICIVKLNKPITWQKNKIKLVVLLALKFEEIDSTKAFFKRLYALLEHNDFLTRIEESKACFEIIEIFKTGGV